MLAKEPYDQMNDLGENVILSGSAGQAKVLEIQAIVLRFSENISLRANQLISIQMPGSVDQRPVDLTRPPASSFQYRA